MWASTLTSDLQICYTVAFLLAEIPSENINSIMWCFPWDSVFVSALPWEAGENLFQPHGVPPLPPSSPTLVILSCFLLSSSTYVTLFLFLKFIFTGMSPSLLIDSALACGVSVAELSGFGCVQQSILSSHKGYSCSISIPQCSLSTTILKNKTNSKPKQSRKFIL